MCQRADFDFLSAGVALKVVKLGATFALKSLSAADPAFIGRQCAIKPTCFADMAAVIRITLVQRVVRVMGAQILGICPNDLYIFKSQHSSYPVLVCQRFLKQQFCIDEQHRQFGIGLCQ